MTNKIRSRTIFFILGACTICAVSLLIVSAVFRAEPGQDERHSEGYRMLKTLDAGLEELQRMNAIAGRR
jgi:hypothetical protein